MTSRTSFTSFSKIVGMSLGWFLRKTTLKFHTAACLMTGPQRLPQSVLHTVRSSNSSCNLQYPLLSLRSSSSCLHLRPRLPVTSIFPSIFPSTACIRRQFLCKIWPIQLVFLHFTVCRIFLSLSILCNAYSFLTRSVQLIFCVLLQHQIEKLLSYYWSTFRTVQFPAPYKKYTSNVDFYFFLPWI